MNFSERSMRISPVISPSEVRVTYSYRRKLLKQAFVPGALVVPVAGERVSGPIQVAVSGRDHAALSTVHENCQACDLRLDAVAQGTDQVRAENADFRSQHFRMNRVVDQRRNRLA